MHLARHARFLTLALAASGCGEAPPATSPAPIGSTEPGSALVARTGTPGPSGGAGADCAPEPRLMGRVLEKLDAASYSYLRLETEDGEVWAAVPQAAVAAGELVELKSPLAMDGFESRSLGRVFERIYFGALDGQPVGHGGTGGGAGAGQQLAEPSRPAVQRLERAPGGAGVTVAELFAERGSFAGREVAVRGQVVRVANGILGANWLHLRDGTGTPEAGDHDLTVTTAQQAAVGDVVIARGRVAVDRDLGSGYAYPVLLEGAKLEP